MMSGRIASMSALSGILCLVYSHALVTDGTTCLARSAAHCSRRSDALRLGPAQT